MLLQPGQFTLQLGQFTRLVPPAVLMMAVSLISYALEAARYYLWPLVITYVVEAVRYAVTARRR